MKQIFLFLIICCLTSLHLYSQAVAINAAGQTTVHPSSILDISSTSKGLLIPRMTFANRVNIISPANGLMVYDSTSNNLWLRKPSGWSEMAEGWLVNHGANYTFNSDGRGVVIHNGRVGPHDGILNVSKEGATTGVEDVLAIYRSTSGTASDGIGGAIVFRNEGPGNVLAIGARIAAINGGAATGRHALRFTVFESGIGFNQLYINPTGVAIGHTFVDATAKLDVDGSVKINGEVNRPSTAAANLVPICYGVIAGDGTIASGTGNFTCTRVTRGEFRITITGEMFNRNTYTTVVTPHERNSPIVGNVYDETNSLKVFMYSSITGNTFDVPFSFVVYKL